jgi:hypothetical protein
MMPLNMQLPVTPNSLTLNMGPKISNAGSKCGPRIKIKFFFFILQSISDSATMKVEVNFFLNI